DVGLAPIVVTQGLEQAAVQKWDATVESLTPRLVTAIAGQRVVKERFEDVIKEIVVSAVLAIRETPQKIARAGAPILSLFSSEPALLLQKVEKDNLAQELLRKVDSRDSLVFELSNNGLVSFDYFFEARV